jgi:hypothetical protein
MGVDTNTVILLKSILASDSLRKIFRTVAENRIATKDDLIKVVQSAPESEAAASGSPDPESQLNALTEADLIGVSSDRQKYYVTAKGLKVASDLNQLSGELHI